MTEISWQSNDDGEWTGKTDDGEIVGPYSSVEEVHQASIEMLGPDPEQLTGESADGGLAFLFTRRPALLHNQQEN